MSVSPSVTSRPPSIARTPSTNPSQLSKSTLQCASHSLSATHPFRSPRCASSISCPRTPSSIHQNSGSAPGSRTTKPCAMGFQYRSQCSNAGLRMRWSSTLSANPIPSSPIPIPIPSNLNPTSSPRAPSNSPAKTLPLTAPSSHHFPTPAILSLSLCPSNPGRASTPNHSQTPRMTARPPSSASPSRVCGPSPRARRAAAQAGSATKSLRARPLAKGQVRRRVARMRALPSFGVVLAGLAGVDEVEEGGG
ncbi:uncharacterized protein K441DRAFT_9627, partial [Cenococcum geophilum 1.58]|uniref:uncharacterized protein n=1 Tax=Cenococcum geophilum 1.58 TaxID=794803 RepID=UPI00358EEA1F